MPRHIHFRGVDKRGAGISGFMSDDVPLDVFVVRKFKQGWQELRVTDSIDLRLIGGLDRVNGKRVWWCEGE
jgi:hypothetical protein